MLWTVLHFSPIYIYSEKILIGHFCLSCSTDQIKERVIKTTCATYLDVSHDIVMKIPLPTEDISFSLKKKVKTSYLRLCCVFNPKQYKERIFKK